MGAGWVGGPSPGPLFRRRQQMNFRPALDQGIAHTEMVCLVTSGSGRDISLHLQEGPGPGGGKVWAGIPSGCSLTCPLLQQVTG